MSLSQLEMISRNRPGPHAEQVGVRYSVLDSAVADFKRRLDEAFNRPCPHCGEQERPFPINPRNRPIDFHWQMNRLKRMQREDAVIEEVLFAEGV